MARRLDHVDPGRDGAAADLPDGVREEALAAAALKSPFTVDSASVLVSSVTPADEGRALLVRLYNPTDSPASATIRPATSGARLSFADADGRILESTAGSVTVRPRASRLVRIDLK